MKQTIVPPREKQFLYKAKGKARAESPSPPLPSSLSPVFASQTSASTSSSCASNDLSVPAPLELSRTPESASDNDDNTSEPSTKRKEKQEGNTPRPLDRKGAFSDYPTPTLPAQEEGAEVQTVPVHLTKSFLDQVQDLDVSGCLPHTGGGCHHKGDRAATMTIIRCVWLRCAPTRAVSSSDATAVVGWRGGWRGTPIQHISSTTSTAVCGGNS